MNNDCTVLVTSCDAYRDVEAPFLKLFRKYWPDCPFDLMLLIGAGSGSIFLLRWFWMRINAWSEIAGMGVSFVCALVLQFGFPDLLSW